MREIGYYWVVLPQIGKLIAYYNGYCWRIPYSNTDYYDHNFDLIEDAKIDVDEMYANLIKITNRYQPGKDDEQRNNI